MPGKACSPPGRLPITELATALPAWSFSARRAIAHSPKSGVCRTELICQAPAPRKKRHMSRSFPSITGQRQIEKPPTHPFSRWHSPAAFFPWRVFGVCRKRYGRILSDTVSTLSRPLLQLRAQVQIADQTVQIGRLNPERTGGLGHIAFALL